MDNIIELFDSFININKDQIVFMKTKVEWDLREVNVFFYMTNNINIRDKFTFMDLDPSDQFDFDQEFHHAVERYYAIRK
jgi:hypothetical protein